MGMLNLGRILDRGRLVIGLLVAIPIGVMITAPSGSQESAQPKEWSAQFSRPSTPNQGASTPGDASGGGGVPVSLATAQARAASAQLVVGDDGEDEGHETAPLPKSYVPGLPPTADLAAVLRASEQRNNPNAAPPTTSNSAIALTRNPNMVFVRQSQVSDLMSGQIDPRVVDFLTWVAKRHRITITSLRTDHSTYVAGSGRVSAHHVGRAVDIAAVDGQSCIGTRDSNCGRLYEEIVNSLRGTQYQPSQVIHGYDLWPTEGWNFAMGNHRDHIHVGY
jgi:hypothetical protein